MNKLAKKKQMMAAKMSKLMDSVHTKKPAVAGGWHSKHDKLAKKLPF